MKFRIPILGNTVMITPRNQSYIEFHPELRATLYRAHNTRFPGFKPKNVLDLGSLKEWFYTRQLIESPNGLVLSRHVVTDDGVELMAQDWVHDNENISDFNVHAAGTGDNGESTSDSELQNEVESRESGELSQPEDNKVRTIATIEFNSSHGIVEHGIFNDTSNGVLWDRSVFDVINVSDGDSIEFKYTLTINSGG